MKVGLFGIRHCSFQRRVQPVSLIDWYQKSEVKAHQMRSVYMVIALQWVYPHYTKRRSKRKSSVQFNIQQMAWNFIVLNHRALSCKVVKLLKGIHSNLFLLQGFSIIYYFYWLVQFEILHAAVSVTIIIIAIKYLMEQQLSS